MIIKNPNKLIYDNKIIEKEDTDFISFLDNEYLDAFNDWRQKNPEIEIVQMEVKPIKAYEDNFYDYKSHTNKKQLLLINAVTLQFNDSGKDYSYPNTIYEM